MSQQGGAGACGSSLGADSPQLWSKVQVCEGRKACLLMGVELGMGTHEPIRRLSTHQEV